MKKEIKSDKNMTNKSVKLLSISVNEWVMNTLSDVINDEDLSAVRSAMENNQEKLEKVLINKKSVKKIKNVNAPKRPKTSYIFFCLDKRSEIIESTPNMPAKDIIKELGSAWRSLSSDSKTKYVDLAHKDKERYDKEIKDSPTPITGAIVNKPSTKTRVKSDTSNRYKYYCKYYKEYVKEEHPDFSVKEINTFLRDGWNKCTEEDKESWNQVLNQPPVKKRQKDPRGDGYVLFAKEERQNFKDSNHGVSNHKLNKVIGNAWKDLAVEERDDYEDRAGSTGGLSP